MDLSSHLAEYLHDDTSAAAANPATLLMQAERAQQWLIDVYLTEWLQLVGELPASRAKSSSVAMRLRLRILGREAAQLAKPRDKAELVFYLESLHTILRSAAREIGAPDSRAMQWGVWGRDIPMAMAYAFGDSSVLDPVICEGIAPCCMYAAFVVSVGLEDPAAADEIEERMFERRPRELLALIQQTPAAPEA